jgi:predicted aspartyl protease
VIILVRARGVGAHACTHTRVHVIAAAIVLLACTAALAQKTVYKWTDEKGVVHFSDAQVPEQGRKEKLELVKPPAMTAGVAEPSNGAMLSNSGSRRYVQVTLEGPSVTRDVSMLVDTGAEMTTITEDLANQLGVEFVQATSIVGVTGVGHGWIGRLSRLRIEDREVTNWNVMVSSSVPVNLLGSDVLDALNLSIHRDRLE